MHVRSPAPTKFSVARAVAVPTHSSSRLWQEPASDLDTHSFCVVAVPSILSTHHTPANLSSVSRNCHQFIHWQDNAVLRHRWGKKKQRASAVLVASWRVGRHNRNLLVWAPTLNSYTKSCNSPTHICKLSGVPTWFEPVHNRASHHGTLANFESAPACRVVVW